MTKDVEVITLKDKQQSLPVRLNRKGLLLFRERFTAEHKGRDEIEGDDMKGDIENREAHRRVHRFHKLWVDVIDGKVCMQEDNPFRKLRFPSDKKTADDT